MKRRVISAVCFMLLVVSIFSISARAYNIDEAIDTVYDAADNQVTDSEGNKYLYDPSNGEYVRVRDMRDRFMGSGTPIENLKDTRLNKSNDSYIRGGSTPEVPGGTGFGFFFNSDFQNNYTTGTAIMYDIICPTTAGGNVSDWLYLTSTNRSAKGVEAFILYYAQEKFCFKVFDWAQPEDTRWQVDIRSDLLLENYIHTKEIHGVQRQFVTVWNATVLIGTNRWRNFVYLKSNQNTFDLIYMYTYDATLAEQQGQHVGSWGPLVETFQDTYSGTNVLGFYNTMIRTQNGESWGNWESLLPSQSYIQGPYLGFSLLFLDKNTGFAVDS